MNNGIVENLIIELSRVPGIGRKTAQRLSFFIIGMPKEDAVSIANAIIAIKENARFCRNCFNITEDETCSICMASHRDSSKICVVEEPSNLIVIEKTGIYKGLYHVLLGALSPIDGITPEKLKIKELLQRVKNGGVSEVIIATNPNTKGFLKPDTVRGNGVSPESEVEPACLLLDSRLEKGRQWHLDRLWTQVRISVNVIA